MNPSRLFQLAVAASIASFLVACDEHGGRGAAAPAPGAAPAATPATPAPGAAPAASAPANNPAAAPTATLKGKVVFKGTVAPPKKIAAIKDNKDCAAVHTDASLPSEDSQVVGANGEFANILVFVSKGLEGRKFEPPAEPVVFDQKGCMYSPHVFGIQVGQKLAIKNSDPLMHNVHALPKSNKEENRPMPKGSPDIITSFKRPEAQPVRIKCDVHPWMLAWAGVFEHPYFAVTGADGSFALPKIAPGAYTITAWHEKLGAKTVDVTLADNEAKELPAIEFAGN